MIGENFTAIDVLTELAVAIIENIPVVNCPNCGTRYLASQTLEAIDCIRQGRQTVAVTKAVQVANFTA